MTSNKKIFNIIVLLGLSFAVLIIFFSSIINLYEKRQSIYSKLGIVIDDHHNEKRYLVNPLKKFRLNPKIIFQIHLK